MAIPTVWDRNRNMPAINPIGLRYHQARVFLLIFAIVTSAYLLTYRARIESGDTLRAMDALTSQSRFGDWLMDESTWFKPPLRVRDYHNLPLSNFDVEERLQLNLALPLLQLAEFFPRMGNIHVVWSFNILVTALMAGLIYLILRAFGFADMVGIAVALSAAFATNLWAYSQTFFRESLTGCFLLLALYLMQGSRYRAVLPRIFGVIAGFAALYLAVETKSSAIVALPAIVVFALPRLRFPGTVSFSDFSRILLSGLLISLLVLAFIEPVADALHGLYPGLNPKQNYLSYALRVFLFSPGGSLWGTSPLLLLAIAGAVVLLRQGKHRLVWAICLLTAAYALAHALTTGAHWFGGLSWPPRFLFPVIPVAMLATAPIAEKIMLERNRRLTLVWVVLLAYGIWIQFSAVSLSLVHYGETLPSEAMQLSEWEPGLTNPKYFRWVVLPSRWSDLGIDFVWIRSAFPVWGASFAAYGILAAIMLRAIVRNPRARWRRFTPLLLMLGLPLLYANLSGVYDLDPVTRSQQQALHDVLDKFAKESESGDVLLLPDRLYGNFVLNHLDSANPRPIILPASPAQAASDLQAAELQSSSPNDWFELPSYRALHHLAGKLDRLYLLANTSPFMSWSFRPYERYLALNYFLLRETELEHADITVRLLEYSTRHQAPNPLALYFGEFATDLIFADHIRLAAFTLPAGQTYRAGESLELSLLWQADRRPQQDYTVAWFLADPAGAIPLAQGHDSAPQAGFALTSTWSADTPIWDNRALRLPQTAAPGEYQIWILLYRYDPESGEIQRLPVSGTNVIENGTVGILPHNIVIE